MSRVGASIPAARSTEFLQYIQVNTRLWPISRAANTYLSLDVSGMISLIAEGESGTECGSDRQC